MESKMSPSDERISLRRAVLHKRSSLVVGGLGIGKTFVVKLVGSALNHNVIISIPAVSDLTDAKGLGFPSADGTHAFLPLGQIYHLVNAKSPTIWLIDDLGRGTPAVLAGFMPWLLLNVGTSIVLNVKIASDVVSSNKLLGLKKRTMLSIFYNN